MFIPVSGTAFGKINSLYDYFKKNELLIEISPKKIENVNHRSYAYTHSNISIEMACLESSSFLDTCTN